MTYKLVWLYSHTFLLKEGKLRIGVYDLPHWFDGSLVKDKGPAFWPGFSFTTSILAGWT
jgi:hypothetical protein